MARRGRHAYYSPKSLYPVTINLTDEARELLDLVVARERASRADVIEQLLRNHYKSVSFKELQGDVSA